MKITDTIHALKIPFEIPNTGFRRVVYIYLIVGDEITIIDSGVAGSEKLIFEYIKTIGREPDEISRLLITHAHPDHIGSAKVVQDQTGCKIGAHKNGVRWIENIELQNLERPVPGFFELVGGSAKVDFILDDKTVLDLGDTELEIYATPGHSNDSLSFYDKTSNVLITGDVIPQWSDLPIYDDFYGLHMSLQFLLSFKEVEWLLSSWSDPICGNSLAEKTIEDGIDYIETIDREIAKIEESAVRQDSMKLCREVISN